MTSEVVNCPQSRQCKTGSPFNFATDLKLILQQTEVLQYVWAAYRLVSYQFYSCLEWLLPLSFKIKITGTRPCGEITHTSDRLTVRNSGRSCKVVHLRREIFC